MLRDFYQQLLFKLQSYLKFRLLPNVRFHLHTMEWTAYVLAFVVVAFFIVTATSVYRMIVTKNDTHDIQCLATNIYHEARGEPEQGMYAVALVTLNRVKSENYPDDVCQVVYQQKWNKKKKTYSAAFSWTTGTSGTHNKDIEQKAWSKAIKIAKETYYKQVDNKAGEALFYHADYVKPAWASQKTRITKIGRHIFYK